MHWRLPGSLNKKKLQKLVIRNVGSLGFCKDSQCSLTTVDCKKSYEVFSFCRSKIGGCNSGVFQFWEAPYVNFKWHALEPHFKN